MSELKRKKKRNNYKYTLIKIISGLIILNSVKSSSIQENQDYLPVDNSIQSTINTFINSMNYKPLNIIKTGQNSFNVYFENAVSEVKIDKDNILFNTNYIDGFSERRVVSSLNNNIDFYSHKIPNSYWIPNPDENPLFYDEFGNINNIGKEYFVMKWYKITQEELDYVLAGPMAEGIENDYIDVSAVMRTGINRLFSHLWVNHAIDRLNLDVSSNEVTIYHIFKDPFQFAVYDNERYLKFLGVKEGLGYQAALDTLYNLIANDENISEYNSTIHDYLEFQDKDDPVPSGYISEQFVDGGNKHYRHQKTSDIIPIEESILAVAYYEVNGNKLVLE